MQKFVLYFSGGTMRGVFGAGVATFLQDARLYDRIEAIYGSSVGAVTGAYFLTEQTRTGSSIFYEDLTHDFISTKNFWIGIVDRFRNRFFSKLPEDKIHDAIDLDHLFNIITRVKILHVGAFRNHAISLHVKVMNLSSGTITYHEATEGNLLNLLSASVNMIPYTHRPVMLHGAGYADGSIIDPIGFTEIRRRHPDEKIIIVFNGDARLRWGSILKNHLEGMFAYMMHGAPFYELFATAHRKLRDDLSAIKNDSRALLVTLDRKDPLRSRTRNPARLKQTYEHGIKTGKIILDFLRA